MGEDRQLLRRVHCALIAIRKDGISPWRRQAIQVLWPDGPIRSVSGLWVQAVLQRLVDQDLDVRIGHRRIVVPKLPLKGGTSGRDVLFTRLSLALTGLLIECLAFLGRSTVGWGGSFAELEVGARAQQGEKQSQSQPHDASP